MSTEPWGPAGAPCNEPGHTNPYAKTITFLVRSVYTATVSTCPDLLLVEDQASDAELALHALHALGLDRSVALVRDGAEAIDYLFARGAYADRDAGDQPRLVLLDLKLPKIDGLQVLRAMRNDERTHDIPVVVLTSSKETCDVERCYALGANSYVVKPVDFDQFTEAIQQIGRYWLSTNETKR